MITEAQFQEMRSRTVKAIGQLKPEDAVKSTGTVCLIISGQIRGGKNNMIVTRSGLHFPKPEWAKWRDEAVAQIKRQLPPCFKPMDVQINMRFRYVAGDHRRRDMPAIIDSIFHVLEKAGVVVDDTLLWVCESSREYDKNNPRAIITLSV